jgi:SAM-dependent methyltransferase
VRRFSTEPKTTARAQSISGMLDEAVVCLNFIALKFVLISFTKTFICLTKFMNHLQRQNPMLENTTPCVTLAYAPTPWVLKQCVESKFVYLENPPNYDSFISEFAWEKTSVLEAENRKKAEPTRYAGSTLLKQFRYSVLKRNKFLDLCTQYIPKEASININLLDLGCGTGQLLGDLMGRLPCETASKCIPHGVELSKELARISDEKMNLLGGRCVQDTALNGIEKLPTNYFHIIALASFLEHEINPLPLLKKCYEALTPGGVLIIKVPNYASWNLKMRGDKWCGFRWPDHVNYFTPETLNLMTIKAGLSLKRMNLLDRLPTSDSLYAVYTKHP